MSPKILVVDDQSYMHVLLQHHLARGGFEMIKAGNGHEAIAVATRELPALILMDVMMEGMDGLAALKHLKAQDATRHIPVIMITANAHHVTRAEAEASGASLYLTKPFSPTRSVMEIRRLVLLLAPADQNPA